MPRDYQQPQLFSPWSLLPCPGSRALWMLEASQPGPCALSTPRNSPCVQSSPKARPSSLVAPWEHSLSVVPAGPPGSAWYPHDCGGWGGQSLGLLLVMVRGFWVTRYIMGKAPVLSGHDGDPNVLPSLSSDAHTPPTFLQCPPPHRQVPRY